MNNYAHDYRILGVSPGCSLQTLKTVRRRLVKSWHPDRYPASAERMRAEERIKEINTAFDRLTKYHDAFGVLPNVELPPDVTVEFPNATSDVPIQSHNHQRRSRSLMLWAIALTLTAVTTQVTRSLLREDADEASDLRTAPSSLQTSPAPPTTEPRPASGKAKYFTVGSSLGEVYAAQGVPTSIENGVWHYGKSKVYFAAGVVTSWEHDSSDPLNATALPTNTAKSLPSSFTVGTSKTEVRLVQGAPILETDSLWDYGLSKIYFRDNLVVGWDSSPMQPLKAHR